jgi:signal transduction histidine kinase
VIFSAVIYDIDLEASINRHIYGESDMQTDEVGKQLSTAEQFLALSRVGAALISELDETRLLQLIAETACELTGARFAAFSLRPIDENGQPLVASEGNLFHLAAVIGVTKEQEELFRRMPLGGEGLLAPIFRHGVPVLVADALTHIAHQKHLSPTDKRDSARDAAFAFAHGQLPSEELRSLGVPHGHPIIRSFLGAPLLDREKQVRGGLLLGHPEPGCFTEEHKTLLVGLAAQASVALENARLYRMTQMRAQELNAIFQSIADGVTLVNAQGEILRENAAAWRLRSYLQEQGKDGRTIEELLHIPARQALSDQTVQDRTVTVSDEHGEAKEYLVTASPLHLPGFSSGPLLQREVQSSLSGQDISSAVVVWHDVTERHLRELERAARVRVQQLEAVFEAMTDGVFVYNREGYIIQMNTVARKQLERIAFPDASMHASRRRFSLMVSSNGDRLSAFEQWPVSRVLAGELLTPGCAVDMAFPTVDGQAFYASITGGPLHDERKNLVGAVVICRDVTEQKKLEQIERAARAASEARLALLQMILDELPGSVYLVYGQDARLMLANRAAESLWGAQWPHDQPMVDFLEQQKIRIFAVDGQPLAPSQFATLKAVQQGINIYQHQESIRHPDGTVLPVLVNAVSLGSNQLLSSSELIGDAAAEPAAIVMHQDVTSLKETERLKDEFIALAAHELRTPLAVLKGYVQTLLRQTARGKGPALAEWQTESLQGIDQATARMVELTEDLLDVTRLQAGRLQLHLEPTDLISLTRRAVNRLQLTTQQHQLSLQTEHAHLVASVDPRRLEQILNNLLNNAIKYSPAGGPVAVTISLDKAANTALISIRDHGIGIPVHQQARLFGRFERADNAQLLGIGGTGLGLYLCRELIERQGGRIWFESAEDAGSTFFFTLPLLAEEA